ncbi:hypothetical protein HanIR_Chr17g0845871 [Helianthus annuus]|nr:hypothetical protein HanIR_Chr17g0845871 [Helianthus annuus]
MIYKCRELELKVIASRVYVVIMFGGVKIMSISFQIFICRKTCLWPLLLEAIGE